MKRIIAMMIVAAAIAGCSSSTDAQKALQAAGYTKIETQGYAMFSCSEDDTFKTKFTAVGPTGVKVTGAVCGGWLKGSTIRTD